MMQRFRQAGLVWPTVFAAIGLTILISLGNWQWRRMHWKVGLIETIAARVNQPPIVYGAPNSPDGQRARSLLTRSSPQDPFDTAYTRIQISGRFDHDHEMHVYAGGREGAGWHIYTPLLLDGGGREEAVWINRGFVPDALKAPAARPGSQPEGLVTVTGLLREPVAERWLVPSNDPAANIWYLPSTCEMQRTAYPETMPPEGCDRVRHYLDAEEGGEGWPRGGTTNLELPNKHFGYALTWWGLAATLIGVYVAFAMQRLAGLGRNNATAQ